MEDYTKATKPEETFEWFMHSEKSFRVEETEKIIMDVIACNFPEGAEMTREGFRSFLDEEVARMTTEPDFGTLIQNTLVHSYAIKDASEEELDSNPSYRSEKEYFATAVWQEAVRSVVETIIWQMKQVAMQEMVMNALGLGAEQKQPEVFDINAEVERLKKEASDD